jgi:hypothetical protein
MFTGTNPIFLSIKLITHRISLASHFYHNDSTWCRNAHWTILWQFAPLHHLKTALKRHLNSQSCLSTLYELIEWKRTSCAAQITFQILIWMNSRWKRHHRRICSTRKTDFLRHVQHWPLTQKHTSNFCHVALYINESFSVVDNRISILKNVPCSPEQTTYSYP